jgi:hypothetical protein
MRRDGGPPRERGNLFHDRQRDAVRASLSDRTNSASMSTAGHRQTIKRPSIPRFACVAVALLGPALRADVSLPRIFGDNMVVQRGGPVPVWGRAAPGEEVSVCFGGQEQHAKAGADGRWHVTLSALSTSATPREMTVAGANLVRLKNILVGEVWLCSGQSNMEYAVGVAKPWAPPAATTDPELAQELASTPLPALRLFRVEKKREPPEVVSSGWHEAAGGSARERRRLCHVIRDKWDIPHG